MEFDEMIRTLAANQHGVLSRRQLSAAGVARTDVHHRLARGVLQRLSPRVFRIAGSPDTLAQRSMAAALDVVETAVLSHSSAAAWWQIPGFTSSPIQTTR